MSHSSQTKTISRPTRHIAGVPSPDCNALCRPDEGIHAFVGYTNYADGEKALERCQRRATWAAAGRELLHFAPAPEAAPYVDPSRGLTHAWLVIFRNTK